MKIITCPAQGREIVLALTALAGLSLAVTGCATPASAPRKTTSSAALDKGGAASAGGTAQAGDQAAQTSSELAAKARDAQGNPLSSVPAPLEISQDRGEPLSTSVDEETELGEEVEPSPLDELPENGPDVAPGALAHDKDLVQSAAVAFDIPMVLNDKVAAYVNYFTTAHRSFFEASLARSGRYVEAFQRTFQQAGIPKDLVYMAHVESAFKTNAFSRARAKGIFQFISDTGRRYGLRVDGWVDERSDPAKSAQAAAAYLKELYGMFGDWYLALAAYNAGEGKIQKAVNVTGKSDFWALCSTRQLRRETKEYVPAILAAALIAKDPAKFGFSVTPDAPIPVDTIKVQGPTDLRVLARLAGTDADTLRQLNPQLRKGVTPPNVVTEVKLPAGLGEAAAVAWAALPADDRMVLARHQVSKGESLAGIAHHYDVSTSAVARANGIAKNATLKPGQELVIPAVASPEVDADTLRDHAVTYRVQRGDTLASISRRFRTSPTLIAAASGIGVNATLQVGQRLHIPAKGGGTATAGAAAGTRSSASASATASRSAAATKKASSRPVTHTVRRGETLTRIAGQYAVTVDQICALNKIPVDSVLYPGTRLTIRSN